MGESGDRMVLFLCSGNYYRSRFAEELFNHLAREAGLPWRATSSGLRVDEGLSMNIGPLSWWARQGLRERGITAVGGERMPRQVSQAELEAAAIIVAVKEAEHRPLMQRRHPAWEQRVRYWAVHDLDCAQASDALPELERLVRRLIAELRRRPPD
ncbi:MAG TPA: low molecular weight phosphatase family protein [Phycisphaerae bacterium]|nr:low molecular weight phosphatase family protein [Phycisphaerae bacterium]